MELKKEDRITLAEAAALIDGAKVRSVHYWATRGINGVKLPTIRDAKGRIYTTREALHGFFHAVNREWAPKG